MDGLTSLLEKLSMEDVEKLKVLMSLSTESTAKEIVTLRVFIEEYKILIKNNRSASYYRSVSIALTYLEKYFKPQKAIGSINMKDIESLIMYLQQKVKSNKNNASRNGYGYVVYYMNLKAAFNKAKDWGYVKENYFTKIKLPKRQKTAPAYIDSKQLSVISSKIENEVVRDVIEMGFYTGMRRDEIINLRWKNVNLNTLTITVGDEEYTTKGRKQRFIPICEEALQIFLKIQNAKFSRKKIFEYVFCNGRGKKFTGDYFTKRFKSACKKAGIDKSIHFHSLRHSFASNLAQKGVALNTIKELLGHSSIATTEIYSHLNLETLRKAISVL